MEISALEYTMARRLQTRDRQMEQYKTHTIQLERKQVICTGCNNVRRALDQVIFDADNIGNFISSFDESDAKRPNTELQEKPAAKRHNNGNSEK